MKLLPGALCLLSAAARHGVGDRSRRLSLHLVLMQRGSASLAGGSRAASAGFRLAPWGGGENLAVPSASASALGTGSSKTLLCRKLTELNVRIYDAAYTPTALEQPRTGSLPAGRP